jgi:phospholipase D1/2
MRIGVPVGRLTAFLAIGGSALALWTWLPTTAVDLEEFAAWFAARRDAWYMLPVVMILFVVLGLVLVPVILLVATTGVAFGPLLGPLYAMAGCLASASAGFAIGRLIGLKRVQRLGGERVTRIAGVLKRNGTVAVFLVRKVPAPFTLVNIVVGASTVLYRDFLIGTVLGMGALVVGLAGFGYQLTEAVEDPTPRRLIGAAMFVIVPLTLALIINHAFRRMRPVE